MSGCLEMLCHALIPDVSDWNTHCIMINLKDTGDKDTPFKIIDTHVTLRADHEGEQEGSYLLTDMMRFDRRLEKDPENKDPLNRQTFAIIFCGETFPRYHRYITNH
jgi:hypothetical protein